MVDALQFLAQIKMCPSLVVEIVADRSATPVGHYTAIFSAEERVLQPCRERFRSRVLRIVE